MQRTQSRGSAFYFIATYTKFLMLGHPLCPYFPLFFHKKFFFMFYIVFYTLSLLLIFSLPGDCGCLLLPLCCLAVCEGLSPRLLPCFTPCFKLRSHQTISHALFKNTAHDF